MPIEYKSQQRMKKTCAHSHLSLKMSEAALICGGNGIAEADRPVSLTPCSLTVKLHGVSLCTQVPLKDQQQADVLLQSYAATLVAQLLVPLQLCACSWVLLV